jgi:hypothetical protein
MRTTSGSSASLHQVPPSGPNSLSAERRVEAAAIANHFDGARRSLLRPGTMTIRRRGATSTGQLTANRLGRCLVVVAIILGAPTMTGAAVTDVREFLDRATSVFRTRPVILVTLRSDRGQAAYYRTGKIYVSPWVYESPFRFEIAAHEFGHHLQGPRVASARRAAFRPRSRTVSTRN